MLARLSEYASQSGIETVGSPSGFYHNAPGEVAIEELSWEVCYPVQPNISKLANDKLKFGVREIPATRVAAVIHKGSYRKASPSYEKLQGWIKAHGLKVCGPAEESYLTDVNKTNEEQRIEIRLPSCAASCSRPPPDWNPRSQIKGGNKWNINYRNYHMRRKH